MGFIYRAVHIFPGFGPSFYSNFGDFTQKNRKKEDPVVREASL